MKPLPVRLGSAVAFALAAPGCVPKPAPLPPVQTRPAPAPAPVPSPAPVVSNWIDAPQTPGDWSYRVRADGGIATFGLSAGEPRFAIRCERAARAIALTLSGAASDVAQLTIRTESQTRSLPAAPATAGGIEASLSAADRLLDAMALSKGRFAVEVAGTPTLYLPSWAEITRVIEDCR